MLMLLLLLWAGALRPPQLRLHPLLMVPPLQAWPAALKPQAAWRPSCGWTWTALPVVWPPPPLPPSCWGCRWRGQKEERGRPCVDLCVQTCASVPLQAFVLVVTSCIRTRGN